MPRPRRFASSRRSSRRSGCVDPDGDSEYTTSLTGRITPIESPTPSVGPRFETVHMTLDAVPPPGATADGDGGGEGGGARRGRPDGRPPPAPPRRPSHPQPDPSARGGPDPTPPSGGGAVRRRRKRISRRLASPRSVLMGSGHYLISPWTTELDGDESAPEEERPGDARPARSRPKAARGRPRRGPASEGGAPLIADDDASLSAKGLRRRRRSRRSPVKGGVDPAAAEPSSLSPRREETAGSSSDDGSAERAQKARRTEKEKNEEAQELLSFTAFRITYLVVHIAIMLADGLQGTHLYVLYEGYGYSVASLYCLGFVSGAFTSPFIGPFVDKVGRKKSAILYCALEVFINLLEQYPYFSGLIVSRVIGGVTTNLLFSVFESWLVTEHRRRGYAEEKLETILRDSVIVSNLSAIASGWLAHFLATKFGPVGPFEGAVTCTAVALVLVSFMWTENRGCANSSSKTVGQYMTGAFKTIVSDSNISRIGLIQGLSEGSLQTFVFLWSPALRHFAANAPPTALGLDSDGQPAYGLIFGAFMACGVLGGLAEPSVRGLVTRLVRRGDRRRGGGVRRSDTVVLCQADGGGGGEEEEEVKPAAVEFLTAMVYLTSAALLLAPYLVPQQSPHAFSVSLAAFLVYEFMVGLYMPCEGVIRSIYMPTASICSLMTMLRVIVNVAVAVGVVSTNYVPFTTAFAAISGLMIVSSALQLSLVSREERSNFVVILGLAPRSGGGVGSGGEEVAGGGIGGGKGAPEATPPPLSPESISSNADETSSEEEDGLSVGSD